MKIEIEEYITLKTTCNDYGIYDCDVGDGFVNLNGSIVNIETLIGALYAIRKFQKNL